MLKAVEVWQVQPQLATSAAALSGWSPHVVGVSIATLEAQFPKGWQASKNVTPAEVATAKQLLQNWRKGGVVFAGPGTLPGRRAYRMTEHPKPVAAAQPAPVAVPAPAAAPPPPPPPPPAAAPQPPIPVPPAPGQPTPDLGPPPAPAPASAQITTVRKGEGLAQVAKRLGKPENQQSAQDLRAANVPKGPDAEWKSIPFNQGGIGKVGRKGGLQPGDKLFVPASWGPVADVSRL